MPGFPAESVPDGAIFAPHHLWIGVLAALFLTAIAMNDSPGSDPAVMLAGLLVALFGFWFVWSFYPVTGAALVLVGLLVASVAFVARPFWRDYALAYQLAVALAIGVAWDDAISHAFGIWTPLDWFWRAFIFGVIR